jgi:hypothetical protein
MDRLQPTNLTWFLGWLLAVAVLFWGGLRLPLQTRLGRLGARLYTAGVMVAIFAVAVLANVALTLHDTHFDLTREFEFHTHFEGAAGHSHDPAGCSTVARTKRTAPQPGRPSPLLDTPGFAESRRSVSDARHVCGRTCRRPHEVQNKRLHRGRPPARGAGAVAEGGRESEGCIRAMTLGNR